MMWQIMFLTRIEAKQLANLDVLILNLLFEFSLEYDIEGIRKAHQKEKVDKQKQAPPPNDVMRALGYKV